ncbi:MAG: hypothetical protein ABI861_11865 [Panacibacter sp.]
MRTFFLVLLMAVSNNCFTQKVIIRDTINIKNNFKEHIQEGMKCWNKKNSNSGAFYKVNVTKEPLMQKNDSILYKVIFITNSGSMNLWDADMIFTQMNDAIIYEISNIILQKKSSMNEGVSFIHAPVDEMPNTKGTKITLKSLYKEIERFKSCFK